MNKMMQKRKRTRRENFSQHSPAVTTYHVKIPKNTEQHQRTPKRKKIQQQASAEERELQTQTPQTARKKVATSKEMTGPNRHLAELITIT